MLYHRPPVQQRCAAGTGRQSDLTQHRRGVSPGLQRARQLHDAVRSLTRAGVAPQDIRPRLQGRRRVPCLLERVGEAPPQTVTLFGVTENERALDRFHKLRATTCLAPQLDDQERRVSRDAGRGG